ncbi:VOC family protein [Actinomadura kijaniata]|uniref:VOC family protein n=1 Tax=Actinomadura kijaniata TaxID=46161 RepID=UPI003F1C383D
MGDIEGLHHVGHVVHDMDAAAERYRRLGFAVSPPAYPVLPGEGPCGVANAHVYFLRGFVELVAVIDPGRTPSGARPLPLRVPEERLPGLRAAVRATTGSIAAFLRRFQGLHIAIADTPDIDAVAARLTAAGVAHGGVHAVQRPVETAAGTAMEPARYLEVSAPGLPPGRVPEGRVGFAENAPVEGLRGTDHPNGATGLAGCVLCVADRELPGVRERYGAYFGEPREGRADVTLVAASALGALLPGERPAALPAFVAFTVEVRDITATERLLRAHGVPAARTGAGEVFVPSAAALGAAIVFRQEP